MRPRDSLSSAAMAITSDGEILINAAVVFAGTPEQILRHAIETGQTVFVGFEVDAIGKQQVLGSITQVLSAICTRMIFEFVSRKR